ncbi:Putative aminoacrylate peracid reductase RutC [Paraburkholderia caffeinitolerans]|uniref:Aminoacrylate peracid reductase RutC n=1 Tax=Paraburkholderia caffeinitolerans TaxID=1723730 RepID=A0A6J5FG27_9BURK|nr:MULTISPECIES: RidA family protein [Paraburkholderia]CAB3776847.1 Putative aminoacrylate peracid reductase RutC [Paraburkholderia caffeinitolerans]
MNVQRMHTNKRMSLVVTHGNTVYLAGRTPDDLSDDIEKQTRSVLSIIDGLLADAGTDNSQLLSAQIWLKHVEKDFEKMNAIWEAWLPEGCAPARATVQADLSIPEALIEIMVVAAR